MPVTAQIIGAVLVRNEKNEVGAILFVLWRHGESLARGRKDFDA
jgi:hypothetical protein